MNNNYDNGMAFMVTWLKSNQTFVEWIEKFGTILPRRMIVSTNRKIQLPYQKISKKFMKLRKNKYVLVEEASKIQKSYVYPKWQWMLDNLFADEEKTWRNRDVILLMNAKNDIDRACEQSFKVNSSYKEVYT